jgi:hypothetical protein
MGIPRELLEDTSSAARKKVARMRRNYAFDRARYFLPVATATNVMLLMSARAWVQLCQFLLSHALPEARQLGELARGELALCAPRLIKHARRSEPHERILEAEFAALVRRARSDAPFERESGQTLDRPAIPALSVMAPPEVSPEQIAKDLAWHTNRYAPVGSGLQRLSVRFGWSAVGFAEIRDLNRHRTGTKYCPQAPVGFYFALDQAAGEGLAATLSALQPEGVVGGAASGKARQLLQAGEPTYIYWSLLGTQYPYEHITTADKFLYEAELRTGLGAHFRYAKHLRDALGLWYERFPATRGLVLEGEGEPE